MRPMSSAARQAYLAKYCHTKPTIDLWKPYLQSTPQRVLKRSLFSRRCHKMSQIQPYHVIHIPDHVKCHGKYLSKSEHHQVCAAPRSLETISSLNIKYKHNKNLTKTHKSRSQKSKPRRTISNEHQHLLQQVKVQAYMKVQEENQKQERESKRNTNQFNKAMRERRLHYLFLLNHQISSIKIDLVTDGGQMY